MILGGVFYLVGGPDGKGSDCKSVALTSNVFDSRTYLQENILEDLDEHELWYKYPHHRLWFNKLYLAEQFGHYCGPCGTAPNISGNYVVRPIYNLAGMGLGARVQHIDSKDRSATPPGYFWCQYFSGDHYSVSYRWDDSWKPIHAWIGYNDKGNLTKFTSWIRATECIPTVPERLNCLSDVGVINIEFKGDKPIEIHLRASGNPDGSTYSSYNEYIPVWKSDDCNLVAEHIERGYIFLNDSADMSDVEPYISEHRIGFLVR
jgi:hypothetical protein